MRNWSVPYGVTRSTGERGSNTPSWTTTRARNRLARYLTLPTSHGISPLIQDALSSAPRNPKLVSPLHFIGRLPCGLQPYHVVNASPTGPWSASNPQRLRGLRAQTKMAAASTICEGGTVREPNPRCLSPPSETGKHNSLVFPRNLYYPIVSDARRAH